MIGTVMGLVHGLPGTTFSSAGQRGSHDSDKAARLTLDELERWFAVAVAKFYHLRPHGGLLGQAPLRRWEEGMRKLAAEGGTVPVPRDPRAYLVDFLPVVRRTLRRDGIRLDHVTYFSAALRAWIAARDRPAPLLVRRDPRDLSRPAISLCEHRFEPFLLPSWEDGREFGRLLASFEAVLPLREPSGLGTPPIRALALRRSEGTIGEVAALLSAAADAAFRSGEERLAPEMIEAAECQPPCVRRRMFERALR